MDDKILALNERHGIAMEYAYLADLDIRDGNIEAAKIKYRLAYALECEIVPELAKMDIEPSRSAILHSAASLALNCGEYREAEKLIATALAGDPPPSIAFQLRELLMQVVPQLQQAAGD